MSLFERGSVPLMVRNAKHPTQVLLTYLAKGMGGRSGWLTKPALKP